jgi:hypothetical protein
MINMGDSDCTSEREKRLLDCDDSDDSLYDKFFNLDPSIALTNPL